MIASRSTACMALTLAALIAAPAARAEGVAPAEGDRAQALFEEGVALLERGAFDEACPKLEESQRLDPAGGTALDLAYCFERAGRVASAYRAYVEALRLAVADKRDDRRQAAQDKLARLEPRLPRVRVVLGPTARVAGIDVRLDGTPFRDGEVGLVHFVDPGPHRVTASAPGRPPFERTFYGAEFAPTTEIAVDADLRPPASAASTASTAPPRVDNGRRSAAIVLGATGFGALVAGATVGGFAFGEHARSDRLCPNGACSADGVAAENRANALAWGSNVAIGVGIVTVGVATYLWLTSKSSPSVTASASGALYRF
jgi:hypothetical protein